MERAIPHLPADDLREAREFYASKLGFQVEFEVTENDRDGILGLSRGGIHLIVDSPMEGHGRDACVSLEVEDADACYREWSARVEVLRAPRDEDWGARTFDLLDPFGNTLFVVGPRRQRLTAGTRPAMIRAAAPDDFDAIWPIFQEIVAAGETYAYDRDTAKEQAFALWMEAPDATFVAVEEGEVLGTYFLKKNQAGPGSHVCNCGYMVSSAARGRGLATAMCEHSQKVALEMGFLAMQFNLVVETNRGAVRLWRKLGFEIVGTIPRAFRHPERGLVGAHVMFKWL